MNKSEKYVSSYDLFPLINDVLSNGNKVKFTVSGNSMIPWIRNNKDQVLLKRPSIEELKIGDIILFKNDYDKYILHRIYTVCDDGYRTIGDGCIVDDGMVDNSQIIGVVEKIYRNDKEINCNSILWLCIFHTWRKLLPVRKYLLNIYCMLAKLKHKGSKLFKSFIQFEVFKR